MIKKLSIIIPIFNEEKTIGELLRRVIEIRLPMKIRKEIIIVDDGSTDDSKLKVTSAIRLAKFKQVKRLFHKENLGKGAAIRTGLENASGNLVIIQDADLEYNPKDYSKLLDPIFKKKASIVYGSRLINYPLRFLGKNKSVLPLHLIANRFLTLLTNLLYRGNLTDMETGYKVFTKRVLESIVLKSDRFDFEPEVTAKLLRKGFKIYEVPIRVIPRTYKEGKKITWKDGLIAILTLVKYRLIK